MATRVKRINVSITKAELYNTTYTFATQPSTSGDITTRVVVDRIWWTADRNMYQQQTFSLNCGGVPAVWFTANSNGPYLQPEYYGVLGPNNINGVQFVGSSSTNLINNQWNGGATVLETPGLGASLSGSGFWINARGSYFPPAVTSWCIPPSFYSSVGENLTLTATINATSTNVACLVSLICIGEY